MPQDMTKINRKPENITKTHRQYVMEQLYSMIESGNIVGLTNTQIAKQFDTRRQTISQYLKKIYKDMPKQDLKQIEFNLKALFDKIFRVAQNMLNKAQTPAEQERACKLLLLSVREFTDFLERWNIKPKTPENINISGEVEKQITVNIVHHRQLPHQEAEWKSTQQ